MGETVRRRSPKLSRERLVAAALDLIDSEGPDRLTVRRVAAVLDVTPMALYWHFANKEELLDGIGDALSARFDLSGVESDADWDGRLTVLLHTLIDAFAEHPGAAEIAMRRMLYTDAGRRATELGLEALVEAGLREDDAFLMGRYLLRSAVAIATEPAFTGTMTSSERAFALKREFEEELDETEDRFPLLKRLRSRVSEPSDVRRYRETAVNVLVDGIRQFGT